MPVFTDTSKDKNPAPRSRSQSLSANAEALFFSYTGSNVVPYGPQQNMLNNFTYVFNEGPFETIEELTASWNIGNCRRALQAYLYYEREIFLTPEEVLQPNGYLRTGEFIFKSKEEIDWNRLEPGDIIYAEIICNKRGEIVDRSLAAFGTADEYFIALHTAIYTGKMNEEIYHATAIDGISCLWSLEKFNSFYKPVAVKRIVHST